MAVHIAPRRSRGLRHLLSIVALLSVCAVCGDRPGGEPASQGPHPQVSTWLDRTGRGPAIEPASATTPAAATPAWPPLGPDKVRFEMTEPFRTTDTGALVLDARTRVSLDEWLLLGTDSATDAQGALDALPEPARSQAQQLLEHYRSYQLDVRQQIDPAQAPDSLDELTTQFELLRRLRRLHLGDPAARSLFDEEERITQALIKLILAQDQTQGMSLQERAEKAQQAWMQQHQRAD